MKVTDLRIYVEVFELLKTMDKYIVNFPREVKYSYGTELRKLGVEIVKDICIANESVLDQERRIVYLERAYGNYEAYKMSTRLVYAAKAISPKQMSVIGSFIGKIGPMIINWKKTAQKRSKAYADAIKTEDMADSTDVEFLK